MQSTVQFADRMAWTVDPLPAGGLLQRCSSVSTACEIPSGQMHLLKQHSVAGNLRVGLRRPCGDLERMDYSYTRIGLYIMRHPGLRRFTRQNPCRQLVYLWRKSLLNAGQVGLLWLLDHA